jgi:7-cyano-7-deazaguanine synthase
MRKIVGIVSGGIDSVSFAASRIQSSEDELHVLTFNYGQKANKEIEAAREALKGIVKEFKVLDISFMKSLWPNTQLTDDSVAVEDSYSPSVVVPIRNAVFITIGMAYAYSIGADEVVTGSHLSDSGVFKGEPMYPDCTPEFTEALQTALHIGHFREGRKTLILNPSVFNMGKADIIAAGYPILGDNIFKTWSCYNSAEKQCGVCESCRNRQHAFAKANIVDKTVYATLS